MLQRIGYRLFPCHLVIWKIIDLQSSRNFSLQMKFMNILFKKIIDMNIISTYGDRQAFDQHKLTIDHLKRLDWHVLPDWDSSWLQWILLLNCMRQKPPIFLETRWLQSSGWPEHRRFRNWIGCFVQLLRSILIENKALIFHDKHINNCLQNQY